MSANHSLSRRHFVAVTAASAAGLMAQGRKIPVGLQQVAVGQAMQKDLPGTLRAVAKMGYEVVEFSATLFFNWTPAQAKENRALLDSLNLRCHSTHNEIASFTGDGLSKAMELNQILGLDTLVSVRGPQPTGGRGPNAKPVTLDQWKEYNEIVSKAAERMRASKMLLGFHNHDVEFKTLEGTRPIDMLAANKDFTAFHLNIGLCLQGGGDPVAFINQVPGGSRRCWFRTIRARRNGSRSSPRRKAPAG